ncbi:MAG: acyl-CoA/acyl-ACP dehydrogenase, partial [Microbacteriaceae bacterium]|nr:acyl-CoA/acyl-ACP dehydrogenase [Burkholderiaceae bacterium]
MPLTAAESSLVEQATTLAREQISPHAARWERERRIGHEALQAAVALGLTRLQLPVSGGGLDASFSCKAAVAEALAAGDFGFAMSWVNTHNVAAKLARDAAPHIAARYVPDLVAGRRLGCTALTEPGAGSDFAAITTLATQVDGGWRIEGAKAWITNAAEADVGGLYGPAPPGRGGRGGAGL